MTENCNCETEKCECEETTKKTKMYTIVLKEKGSDGNFMCIDADFISPTFPFGESCPTLMAVSGDHAYFMPVSQINWYEQNTGVHKDLELAQSMIKEKMKKPTHDASIG